MLGWLLLAALHPSQLPAPIQNAIGGCLLGTLFGQVSLAAGWCALGPLSLMSRLPLAFGWMGALVVALGFNIAFDGPPGGGLMILVIVGAALIVQWLLVQLPIWPLVALYGLRICSQGAAAAPNYLRDGQFGIRQLMILTITVALVLGIGRLALGGLKADDFRGVASGVAIFAFLAISATLISIPLITAALLPRKTLLAIGAALGLVVLTTIVEIPLMRRVGWSPTEYDTVVWMNVSLSAWILGTLLLLRAGGYRLAARAAATPACSA
jgi:hypothetical protein